MVDQHRQAAFPVVPAVAALTAAAAALAGAALALLNWLGEPVADRWAVLFAAAVTWTAAVGGLAPVAVAGPNGVSATITAYFIGMGARLATCLAAALVGVWVLDLAVTPLALTMSGLYLPMLAVEAMFVARYLRLKDPNSPRRTSAPAEVTA